MVRNVNSGPSPLISENITQRMNIGAQDFTQGWTRNRQVAVGEDSQTANCGAVEKRSMV